MSVEILYVYIGINLKIYIDFEPLDRSLACLGIVYCLLCCNLIHSNYY